jgi:hypothetical protein
VCVVQYIYEKDPTLLTISLENAADYFQAALKFEVPGFLEACNASLVSLLSPENVFDIMELGAGFDLPGLQNICWEFIEHRTMKVLALHLHNVDSFVKILKNDHLNVPEAELLKCVFGLVLVQCFRSAS